ncbi:MAG: glycosyltransferase family 2 protein [Bacteroidota bacterium]|nr:glycosyltransferase family 2 protein [Bacteroidota bacterium]
MSQIASPFISVVSPVYGAADLVDLLVVNISKVLRTLTPSFEIILVDDGSLDGAWIKIEQNVQRVPQVKGIKLSRNFGQHRAIMAGLKLSTGQWVVVMDCDLQDNPLEIPHMLQKALEGYKIVLAQRNNKKHPLLKIFLSQIFNRVLSFLTNLPFDSRIGNFGLYHREVISAICQESERVQYFPMMVQKVNFRRTVLENEHKERPIGNSSYSVGKNLKLAASVLFSNFSKPLQKTIPISILIAFLAGLLVYCFSSQPGNNYPEGGFNFSQIVVPTGLFFFLCTIRFYLTKILKKKQNQTSYVIEKKVNFDNH